MAVNVIDTLKPKNNGDFPIVEAEDVAVGSVRLNDALNDKASQTALDATNTAIAGKANASDVSTATSNLQSQINELITPVTQDAEVQNARVDTSGTSYTTLKERLDTTYYNQMADIEQVQAGYTHFPESIFILGSIATDGSVDTTYTSRIVMESISLTTDPLSLTIAAGKSVVYCTYTAGGEKETRTPSITGTLNIPANTRFRICIYPTTGEVLTDVADISEFARTVMYDSALSERIKFLEGSNSVTTEKIVDNAVTREKASFIVHKEGTNYIADWVDNTYINADGVETPSTGLYSTTPVYLEPETSYYWDKLYSGYYAFYDANGAVLESHGSADAPANPFTTPANTAYARFTINEAVRKTTAWISTEDTAPDPFEYELTGVAVSVQGNIEDGSITGPKIANQAVSPNKTTFIIQKPNSNCISGWVNDTYINANGVETAHEGFYSTTPVYLQPNTQYYWAQLYKGYYTFYSEDGTVIESHGLNDPPANPFTLPNGAAYARFTAVTNEQHLIGWISTANAEPEPYELVLTGVNADYSSNPCDYNQPYINAFNTCLCIGDSLTYGVFNHNESGTTQYTSDPTKAYPIKLQKMTGITCTNEGLSSATFDEWYAQKASVLTSGYDMAIIQLGVNDRFRYEGWTETAETALNNIVSDLQAANEGIKIFVATIIPALGFKGPIFDEISQGIRDAVATINDPNVILLDMAAYGHTADNQGYNVGHLSELGYTRLAMDYRNYISWVMAQNMVAFRNIQNIGTDYYYE